MSPEQVLAQADLIIVASIEGVDSRWSGRGKGMAFTDYSLSVDHVLFDRDGLLRHQTEGGIFRLSFGGGVIDGREILISGVPAFVQGEKVILFIDSKEIGTISPLVGMSAGDYRVSTTADNNGMVVGPAGMVKRSFFSESDDRPNGWTLDGFLDEIKRALPIAQADPTLMPDHEEVMGAAESKAYTGSQIPQATPLVEGVVPVPSQGTIVPSQDTTRIPTPNEN